MWASVSRLSVLLLYLTLLLPVSSAFQFPWQREPSRIRLSSSHRLEVPADRAILSVHVQSKGSSQDVVSEEIRTGQDELMAFLEPLKYHGRSKQTSGVVGAHHSTLSRTFDNHPFPASQAVDSGQSTLSRTVDTHSLDPSANANSGLKYDDFYNHPNLRITVKALDTSNFRTKPTLLGERPIHEARMEYEVEVLNFSILSDVVFNISALPRTSIQNLKWKLSDAATERATGQCMEGAARLLKLKADKVKDTLGMTDVRAVDVVEQWSERWPSSRNRWDHYVHADEVVLTSMHDELGENYHAPRRTGFQPKTLEFEVKLDGEFLAS